MMCFHVFNPEPLNERFNRISKLVFSCVFCFTVGTTDQFSDRIQFPVFPVVYSVAVSFQELCREVDKSFVAQSA